MPPFPRHGLMVCACVCARAAMNGCTSVFETKLEGEGGRDANEKVSR